MQEIIKELVGGLMPVIIIALGCVIYLAVRNKLRGKKWNYLDPDSSDKM
jgi:hypothetical protein